MAKQNDQTVLNLWKAGLPIKTSWITYMDPDLKPKWKAVSEKSASDAFVQDAAAVAELEDASAFEKATLLFSGSQKILTERETMKTELRATILRYIETGVLFGYGFEPPRSLNSTPVEIPKSLWRGKCNWDASALEAQGLKFIEIRLTTSRIRNEIIAEKPRSFTSEAKPVGRPSIQADVQRAFAALLQSGRIEIDKSAKSHFPPIREWMRKTNPERYPPTEKLGDEGIRYHFSPLFKALKQKQ